MFFDIFKSGIFSLPPIDGTGQKILSPIQMFHRLPRAFALLKPGNTSQNFLNEIRQIIYSLYQVNKITKNVNNSIMNSIQL